LLDHHLPSTIAGVTYTPVPNVVAGSRPASGRATVSLILGVAGFFGFFLVIPSVLAVVFGHLALRETRTGAKTGHGTAIAGLIFGYLVAIPMLFIAAMMAFYAILGPAT
jgi:hypothetical protein